MANRRRRKILERGPESTGVRALDDFIYDLQLTLAGLLIPARHVMQTTKELLQAKGEYTVILDADILREIRADIQDQHRLINDQWQERTE